MTRNQQLNEASGVALWRQIADAISRDISNGDLEIGDAVPSYRELCATWHVGAGTAMSALADLRRRGLIEAERGQSSRVVRSPAVARLTADRYRHGDDRSPVAADLDRANHSATPQGHVTTEPASRQIARRLHIEPGDPVSRADYAWTDEVGPYERSTQWEPLTLTRNTSAEVPPAEGEPNVITRMKHIGKHVTYVRENWYSRMPTAAESEQLDLEEGVPVMVCERTHYANTAPVETADITIRGDRTVLVVDHLVGGDV